MFRVEPGEPRLESTGYLAYGDDADGAGQKQRVPRNSSFKKLSGAKQASQKLAQPARPAKKPKVSYLAGKQTVTHTAGGELVFYPQAVDEMKHRSIGPTDAAMPPSLFAGTTEGGTYGTRSSLPRTGAGKQARPPSSSIPSSVHTNAGPVKATRNLPVSHYAGSSLQDQNKRNAAPASGELPRLQGAREHREHRTVDPPLAQLSGRIKADERRNIPHLADNQLGGKSFKIRGQINKRGTMPKPSAGAASSQLPQHPQTGRPETTKSKRKPAGMRGE